MKRLSILLALILCLTSPAQAENDKIDPTTFICAEYLAISTASQKPALFECLQVDGWVSAKAGNKVAAPANMAMLMDEVYEQCLNNPAAKILPLWQKARKDQPLKRESMWRADVTTCGDLVQDPDDMQSFIVWLDGYNRQQTGKGKSVLESDDTFKAYMDACKAKPDALMLDVLKEQTK